MILGRAAQLPLRYMPCHKTLGLLVVEKSIALKRSAVRKRRQWDKGPLCLMIVDYGMCVPCWGTEWKMDNSLR